MKPDALFAIASGLGMVSTTGLLSDLLGPVTGIVGGLPLLGPILDPLLHSVEGVVGPLLDPLLDPLFPILRGMPILGGLLGSLLPPLGLPAAASVDGYNYTMPHNSPSNAAAANAPIDPASCMVEPYVAPDVLSQTFPPFDPVKANVYRYRQQQSVNMGGW